MKYNHFQLWCLYVIVNEKKLLQAYKAIHCINHDQYIMYLHCFQNFQCINFNKGHPEILNQRL